MSLLGPEFHDLTLDDFQRFLEGADTEPLLWEAKGTDMHKAGIRKAVCGFANGRQPAYPILGADKERGGWQLNGVDLAGDPPAWVSSVIEDGLDPVPLVDVRSLPVPGKNDLHVAVVKVPPVAIPPCISRGAVWEGVSGRTIEVKGSARLAELYSRGKAAKDGAMAAACGAVDEVLGARALPGHGTSYLRFSLAVSGTSHPPDISSRLFTRGYEESLVAITNSRLVAITDQAQPFSPKWQAGFSQSNRTLDCEDSITHATRRHWHVRVIWNGTAVVHHGTESATVQPQHLAQEEVRNAWLAACELVEALGGSGPLHMELRVDPHRAMPGRGGVRLPILSLGRYLPGVPDDDALGSVERELRRATGESVYEPDVALKEREDQDSRDGRR